MQLEAVTRLSRQDPLDVNMFYSAQRSGASATFPPIIHSMRWLFGTHCGMDVRQTQATATKKIHS